MTRICGEGSPLRPVSSAKPQNSTVLPSGIVTLLSPKKLRVNFLRPVIWPDAINSAACEDVTRFGVGTEPTWATLQLKSNWPLLPSLIRISLQSAWAGQADH